MPGVTGAGYGGPYQGLSNPTATSDPTLRRSLQNMSEARTENDKAKGFKAGVYYFHQSIPISAVGATSLTANWTTLNTAFAIGGGKSFEYPKSVNAGYADEGVYDDTTGVWTVPQDLGGYWMMFALVPWEADSTGWRAARFRVVGGGPIGAMVVGSNGSASMPTVLQIYGGWEAKPGKQFKVEVAQYNTGGGALDVLGGFGNPNNIAYNLECHRVGDTDERSQT